MRPARRGLLRVHADVPEAAAGTCDVTGLRVLLTADLLVRVAELGELQAVTTWAFAARAPEQVTALERAADALGIHPPAGRCGPGDAAAAPGGPVDVRLTGGAAADDGPGGIVVRVGAARLPRGAGPGTVPDPLAVRLALLASAYHQPAELTEAVLARARHTLGHWRALVGQWAESPSRPMPAPVAATVRDAFETLDTAAALRLLRGLAADDGVPAGARFETFVYADRVLGLDLPRDIGRLGG